MGRPRALQSMHLGYRKLFAKYLSYSAFIGAARENLKGVRFLEKCALAA